jgi:hypothetical protein
VEQEVRAGLRDHAIPEQPAGRRDGHGVGVALERHVGEAVPGIGCLVHEHVFRPIEPGREDGHDAAEAQVRYVTVLDREGCRRRDLGQDPIGRALAARKRKGRRNA